MANKRKKSAAAIQKNVEEMRMKLMQLEDELEAAKEARYELVGRYFVNAFDNCVNFDIIKMSEAEIQRFMRSVRGIYDYETQYEQQQIPLCCDDDISLLDIIGTDD